MFYRRILITALALTAGSLPSAATPRTIVGEWVNRIEECGTHWAYRIGPKSLAADEFACSFDTVSRSGATVRWTGTCNEGNGPEREEVVAKDTREGLVLDFQRGGGEIGPLLSCDRR